MSETPKEYYPIDVLDTPEKQLIRQKIAEILTPELKRRCPGLIITVLNVNEHNVMMNALTEVSNRKVRERSLSRKMRNDTIRPLTLQIVNSA